MVQENAVCQLYIASTSADGVSRLASAVENKKKVSTLNRRVCAATHTYQHAKQTSPRRSKEAFTRNHEGRAARARWRALRSHRGDLSA